jgi:hypothetical protein
MREGDGSLSFSAEIKKLWNCTLLHLQIFVVEQ